MRAAEAIRVSTSCRPSPRPAPDGLPVRGLAAGGVLLGELHVVGLRGAAASVATPKGARARSSRDASCELRAVTAVDAGRRASMTRRPISAPWLWISCMAACSEVDHRRGSISPRRHRFDVPPDPVSLCVDGSELLVGADPGGLHDARDRLFRDLDHGGQLARGRGAGGRLLRVARFDRWRIRAPALDQLPITLDELLELDSHAPAGRIAASDPPDSSSARSCSRLSVASAVACCKCSACCRRSSSRLADPARAARSCSSCPRMASLASRSSVCTSSSSRRKGMSSASIDPALSDRSLEIRGQRLAELLRGIELFLEPRQPALRLGELGGEARSARCSAALAFFEVLSSTASRSVSADRTLAELYPKSLRFRSAMDGVPSAGRWLGWCEDYVRGLEAVQTSRTGSGYGLAATVLDRSGSAGLRRGRLRTGADQPEGRSAPSGACLINQRVVREDDPFGGRSRRLFGGVPGSCELNSAGGSADRCAILCLELDEVERQFGRRRPGCPRRGVRRARRTPPAEHSALRWRR